MKESKIAGFALLIATATLPGSIAYAGSHDFKVLHSFNRADGDEPTFLLHRSNGSLYGVTVVGGDGSNVGTGVLYKIDSAGKFKILHVFADAPDGAIPGRLIEARDGTIYGLTGGGGEKFGGTVYTLDASDNYTIIHAFDPTSEGAGPSFLVQARDGSFYGTNSDNGIPAPGCVNNHANGTLFRMTPAGQVTALHTFCEIIDGSIPDSVLETSAGTLFGTCREDGPLDQNTQGAGTMWRAKASGEVTLLHVFGPKTLNGNEATEPNGVLQGADGLLYGVANHGGRANNGAIFRATLNGRVKTIYSFDAFARHGNDPETNFVLGEDGFFYGTASQGGKHVNDPDRAGVVYRADMTGHVSVLHTFDTAHGMSPTAPPALDLANGKLFVSTIRGGKFFDGVTARLSAQ